MARLSALISRWGNLIALALGAVVLMLGLGKNGLWEPWEMDRADLARTLAAPPEVVIAIARGRGELDKQVRADAARAEVVVKAPESGGPSALRAALDFARAETVAAIVIDADLLLPDPSRDDLWRQAGKLISEAVGNATGASVIVVRSDRQPAAAELTKRLEVERWKDVWERASASFGLDGLAGEGVPAEVGAAAEAEAAASVASGELPFEVVEAGQGERIQASMARGRSEVATRVAFKDKGETVVAPPLETWLRAVSYRIFGVSEWATRLPGVLLLLAALWVLLSTVRMVWTPRVALLTGVVLATLPLFFGQARVISGEPAFVLGMTLVGSGMLLFTLPQVSRRLVWGHLVAGLLVGLFAKGVFALALFGAVAIALPLVSGPSKKLRDWLPALMFLGAAVVTELIVRGSGPGSMWSGLDFADPLFSSGPSVYSRTFDSIIRELGFGFAPWSPIIAVAVGLMIFSSMDEKDPKGLVVVAWFALPVVGLMASLKVGNHFLFVGVGGAAIAVAVMLDRVLKREQGPHALLALFLVMMFYIMRRELKASPEPLVGFLAYDPPFAKEGSLRFPETLELSTLFKQSMIVLGIACLLYFGRVARFALAAVRWARKDRPFIILQGVFGLIASTGALTAIGILHGMGMSNRFGDTIAPAQKALVGRLMTASDPPVLLGDVFLLLVIIAVALRWIFPSAGRAVAALVPAWLYRGRPYRVIWGIVFALFALMLVSVLGVSTPEGYWTELAFSVTGAAALGVSVLFGFLVHRVRRDEPKDRWVPVLAALAMVAFLIATQVVRDAQLKSGLSALLAVLGLFVAVFAVAPWMLARVERFVVGSCVVVGLVLWSITVPLVARGVSVAEVVMPDAGSGMWVAVFTTFGSLMFLGPVLGSILLVLNRHIESVLHLGSKVIGVFRRPRVLAGGGTEVFVLRVDSEKWVAFSEKPQVFVTVAVVVALIGAATHILKLEPALAVNVSQKHILDTWHAKAGEGAPLYKHGSFATQGRKDANFYTADMPEIRDRNAALKVLLGREDQILDVETPLGTETLVFPGWNKDLDQNGDGRRDAPVLSGFATAVGDTVLTDATQKWAPKSLVGRYLRDASGQLWAIVDNDATSVRVADNERLTFGLSPRSRAYYAIDAVRTDLMATAEKRERRALLLPADQLSELNFAYRQLSGGEHLPVLDGSSYRVLLTTSWLNEDEKTQNRLALATYDDKTFAEIKDKRLRREWGNFEDTIQVVGYSTDKDTVSTGSNLRLTVYYKVLKLVKKSLKIFIHMDKGGGGARIAGDHWPLNPTRHTEENKNCGGCYRTDHWLVGDIVEDSYDIEIPEGNTGEYTIWVGLFQPGADTRMQVKSWDKKRVKHDGANRLGLGTFLVK